MSSKQKRAISLIGITGAVYLIFRYLLPLVIPFFAAWAVARIAWPFVRWLNTTCRVPTTWGAIIGVSLLCTAVMISLLLIGEKLLQQSVYFVDNFPIYMEHFLQMIYGACSRMERFFHLSNGCVMEQLGSMTADLQKQITMTAVPYIMNGSMPVIKSFVNLFTTVTVTILAAVLILQERNRIQQWKQTSPFRREIKLLTTRLGMIGGAFIKTELSIMVITMVVVTVGLTWMRNEYSVLLGVLTGLIDVLPVFGSGTIFVPWIAWKLLSGEFMTAAGLGLIYLACYFVREVMEAKLLGRYTGISSLETVAAIYIGWQLFGVAGLFLGPIGWILIKEIDKTWNLS